APIRHRHGYHSHSPATQTSPETGKSDPNESAEPLLRPEQHHDARPVDPKVQGISPTKKQRPGEARPGRLLPAFHYEVLDEVELEAAMGDPLHGREVSVTGAAAGRLTCPPTTAAATNRRRANPPTTRPGPP